jgi:DNA-binding NtrC family response regulator
LEGGPKVSPRLLLVDDEEMFLEYLSRRLINRNYNVTICLSGEEALEKVRGHDFDVVILDVLMPGIDGIEALSEIKKLKPLTEVIMITGHTSQEAGIEGMKLGAYDYLTKPFNTEDLVSKIDKAFEKKTVHEERIRYAAERHETE